MKEMTLFDLLPDEEAQKYKAKKSTDWKWAIGNYLKKEAHNRGNLHT